MKHIRVLRSINNQSIGSAPIPVHLRYRNLHTILIVFIIVSGMILSSCSSLSESTGQPTSQQTNAVVLPISTNTPSPETELTFRVALPQPIGPDENISIDILDEVTGLALNKLSYPMEQVDNQHFITDLRFPIGSVIKYRYARHGSTNTVQEHIASGRVVRYRLYHVQGPGNVEDVVSRWTDTSVQGPTGRISGQALDALTGKPIPSLMVVAGGVQSLTATDGSYLIEGLPPGTHNLVAYTLDGAFQTFQQGARVAAESTTPAELRLLPSQYVNVNWVITPPQDTFPAVPIRLAGNLIQLGNTFADLSGGMSNIASRMPVLTLEPDLTYSLTLSLPTGADIRYIYTMGDGFWNTELTEFGGTRLRQLIIPDHDLVIRDTIASWRSAETQPITFDVLVPPETPLQDGISIQFNPVYGWTEPIPMWHLGENRWAYILNGPEQIIESVRYRFCRNDQCGSADDASTMGPLSPGIAIESDASEQASQKQVQTWAWLSPERIPAFVDEIPVSARGSSFIAGIELQPYFHPTWLSRMPIALEDIKNTGANWVIHTPTWTYTHLDPPILEPLSGVDPLWFDTTSSIVETTKHGLNAAIFPQPKFPSRVDDWWLSSRRDYPWWIVWFERYRSFALHHADLAEQTGASALILGGDWLSPALPGGALSSGVPSGVPTDAETHWRNLLQEIRTRYQGALVWAISPSQAADNIPAFLESVDMLYVQFSDPLAAHLAPSREELAVEVVNILDNSVFNLHTETGKPVILSVSYPSADGSATSCLKTANDDRCIELSALSRPETDMIEIGLDLDEQADIYAAFLWAVNQRSWISGFVSSGYYPPALLQDKSTSVHGKPAEEILRYWYPQLLAAPQ